LLFSAQRRFRFRQRAALFQRFRFAGCPKGNNAGRFPSLEREQLPVVTGVHMQLRETMVAKLFSNGYKHVYMQRALTGGCFLLLIGGIATAQARDPRVDELTKENAQLKLRIADQEKRIAELEKALKALQAAAAPLPTPIPAETPPWHRASNWILIKSGMSETQVVGILGPPTSADASIDKRTLYYTPDAHSASTLNGSVTLIGDRVTAMTPPAFQ
jgi:hypothetical protein